MSTALYRRYRPKTFDEVVNQRHVVQTLVQELDNNRLAHAYLFCGPRGVGKTTVARLLAQAANSPARIAGTKDWQTLSDLPDGHTIDIIEIDAASHTQVDNVRENIIPNAQTAPTVSAYKVFIIDEVHMLSISAFNALLKILEEPPATVIFILATTEVHRVPATIVSRCQRFDFHRIQVADLVARVTSVAEREGVTIDPEVARTIAVLADGSARDADGLLGQVLSLGEKHITAAVAAGVLPRTDSELLVSLFESLATCDITRALQELQRGTDEGVSMDRFSRDWLSLLRHVMLVQLGSQSWETLTISETEHLERVQHAAGAITVARLLESIGVFQKHFRNLSLSEHPQFPFELAFVELIGDTETQPPKPTAPATSHLKKAPAPVKKTKAKEPEKTVTEPLQSKSETTRVSTVGAFSHADVEKVWSSVIKEIGAHNHSLGMILKTATVVGVELPQTVMLGFGFKLHAERVLNQKNREIVAQALEQALGQHVLLTATVDAAYQRSASEVVEPSKKESAELSDLVLQTFGNDVVADSA